MPVTDDIRGINALHQGGMVKKRNKVSLALLTVFALVPSTLVGCSTSESTSSDTTGGSRAKMYASLNGVIADSSVVITGTVRSQVSEPDPPSNRSPHTLSTLVLATNLHLAGLQSAPLSNGVLAPGSEAIVRQIGIPGGHSEAPLLRVGDSYLLMLTPSSLPGEAGKQYYVTGVTAGLWRADRSGGYVQPLNQGDELPAELTVGALRELDQRSESAADDRS